MAEENSKRCESAKLTEADSTKLINGHFADWLEQKVHFTVFMYSELYRHLNLTNCTYMFYKAMDQLLQKR